MTQPNEVVVFSDITIEFKRKKSMVLVWIQLCVFQLISIQFKSSVLLLLFNVVYSKLDYDAKVIVIYIKDKNDH